VMRPPFASPSLSSRAGVSIPPAILPAYKNHHVPHGGPGVIASPFSEMRNV
jgi:hypothetical protein